MDIQVHKSIGDLFFVTSGDYHAMKELDPGDVPLISCGKVRHGIVGFFDIPVGRRYRSCLTIAYNGSWPLLAKFHPYEFGAKDDVAVLVPKEPLQDSTLLYIAASLNAMTWRYSYYRHCYADKVRNTSLVLPSMDGVQIDEDSIKLLCNCDAASLAPRRAEASPVPFPQTKWQKMTVTDIFHISRGDFHSLSALDPGNYPTVSRISEDNGVVGFYDKPDGASIYPQGRITVSTVSGDAFVQLVDFIATDNVLVLTPRNPLKLASLFFFAVMLNQERWRYSYGRQPYLTKFSTSELWMPTDDYGSLNEDYLENLVETTTYWNVVRQAVTLTKHYGDGQR